MQVILCVLGKEREYDGCRKIHYEWVSCDVVECKWVMESCVLLNKTMVERGPDVGWTAGYSLTDFLAHGAPGRLQNLPPYGKEVNVHG